MQSGWVAQYAPFDLDGDWSAFELDLHAFTGNVPVELFGQNPFPRIGELPYLLTLGPHAFYWFGISPLQSAGASLVPAGDSALHVDEQGPHVVIEARVAALFLELFEAA